VNYSTLLVREESGIATVTFNRPDKRNAITYELIDELLAALAALEKSSAQIVVLTGAGKAFCSGMDLDNLRSITSRSAEENLKDSQTVAKLLRTLYDFPKVTIAAVNGAAIAGGCGLATLCDFTIASTEAKFGYTEVRIGFTPAIVSSFLVLQIGEKQARDLLFTGKIIDADEAFRLGLITEVVAPDQLMGRVQQLCEELLQNSPASLVATKELLNSFSAAELDRQIESSMRANAEIRTTEDFREGVTSFLEKRKPKWSGR
jgi:methylglutaconyl-CoA hydratase